MGGQTFLGGSLSVFRGGNVAAGQVGSIWEPVRIRGLDGARQDGPQVGESVDPAGDLCLAKLCAQILGKVVAIPTIATDQLLTERKAQTHLLKML